MKTKTTTVSMIILFIGFSVLAQSISVQKKDGSVQKVPFTKRTIINKGVQVDSKTIIKYSEISTISTANFDAYDQAMNKASKNANKHLKIVFSGDESVYALQLEKLKKRRDGADIARGAGGIMAIVGILSGDRELTALGVTTNAVGQVARDINNDKTADTQTAMLNDLDKRTKEQQAQKSEGDKLRETYGSETVDGVNSLIDKDYKKATAYANVGELSKDANYRLSAIWLKALIAADSKNEVQASKEYERLIIFDPEIKSEDDAKTEIQLLLNEL